MSYTKEQIEGGFNRWLADVEKHPEAYKDTDENSNSVSHAKTLIEFIENENHTNANRQLCALHLKEISSQ